MTVDLIVGSEMSTPPLTAMTLNVFSHSLLLPSSRKMRSIGPCAVKGFPVAQCCLWRRRGGSKSGGSASTCTGSDLNAERNGSTIRLRAAAWGILGNNAGINGEKCFMYSYNRNGSRAASARGFMALFAALTMGLGLMASPAAAAPFAYVTNYLDGTVSVIDTATNTVVATVPAGQVPPVGSP